MQSATSNSDEVGLSTLNQSFESVRYPTFLEVEHITTYRYAKPVACKHPANTG